MKVETYECDVCGKPKKEVNHWWLMAHAGRRLQLIPWPDEGEHEAKATFAWWGFHLCGAECVIKKVNEFLGKEAVSGK